MVWFLFVVFEEIVIQCCLDMALDHLLSVALLIQRRPDAPEVPSHSSSSVKSKLGYFQMEHLQLECLQNILSP